MKNSPKYKNLHSILALLESSMPIADDVSLGQDVAIPQPDLVNLYGCTIGALTKIGSFVEVQKNASIVGYGVMLTNDLVPAPSF